MSTVRWLCLAAVVLGALAQQGSSFLRLSGEGSLAFGALCLFAFLLYALLVAEPPRRTGQTGAEGG